jgi:hypothetical protein
MRRKSIISLLLVLTVASVFSFNSFAAPQSLAKTAAPTAKLVTAGEPMPQGDLTGTLTGRGTLLVNGNAVPSGATILNGSVVATDANSEAVLDLGALGRINLRPSTEIRILLSPNRSEVELRRCGSMTQSVPTGVLARVTTSTSQLYTVASSVGEATVRGKAVKDKQGLDVTLVHEGESKSFDSFEEITANGEATFTINCGDQDYAGGGFISSPYGWLVLLGLSAGVILGVHIGDNPGSTPGPPPQVTPVQP